MAPVLRRRRILLIRRATRNYFHLSGMPSILNSPPSAREHPFCLVITLVYSLPVAERTENTLLRFKSWQNMVKNQKENDMLWVPYIGVGALSICCGTQISESSRARLTAIFAVFFPATNARRGEETALDLSGMPSIPTQQQRKSEKDKTSNTSALLPRMNVFSPRKSIH